MTKVGYLAVDQTGFSIRLTDPNKHPRGQLLDKLAQKKASKVFVDTPRGADHVGYAVGDRWFIVYEVYQWHGNRCLVAVNERVP